MFDMDININDYVAKYSRGEKTLNEFKLLCMNYYNDISYVISNMV
jgi:hypothetical protein